MYQLRIESGAERGQAIPLPLGRDAPIKLTLGRGADVDLQFADGTMSRTQAELRWEGGAWFLRNLSKHGSYVGRKKLAAGRQRKLKPNDALLLGETQVVFALDPNAIATPGQDALTPQTPSIAAPPTLAGYDDQGFFHSGQTLMQMPDDPERSFVVLLRRGPYTEEGGLKVKRRRLYFYALILLLGVVGMVAMAALVFWPTFKKHPADLTLATAFALVPGLLYLPLLKFLDRNGQIPWRNILACMVWGGTVGCGFSLVLNTTGSQYLANFIGSGDAFTTTAILIAPLVEEVIKGMAVLVLFWILHDEFDNVLEGMILGAASGMGFALVENCIYNVRFLESGASTLWVMGAYRMVVNALIGHPIYTAMTGAGLGLQRETPRHDRRRYLFPLLGLAIAIGMHVAWNAAAVYLGRMIGDTTGVMTLVINAALLGGAGLLFFIAAYVFAARRERRVLVAYLAEEVDKGFVDRQELDSFHQALGRLRYELEGLFRYGRQVYRVRRNLRLAQVELAFRKWHLAQGDAAKGEASDRIVHETRDQIRDLRNVLNRLEHKDRSTGRLTPYEDLALGETTHQANPYLAPPPETGPQTGPVRPDEEPPPADPPPPVDPPPVAPPPA